MIESKKAFNKVGGEPTTSLKDFISKTIESDKAEVLKVSILIKKGLKSLYPHD
tara:strand:- start:1438 stop:1596 length:159 start_codon:yes stop_codon:yes gene_type:complete